MFQNMPIASRCVNSLGICAQTDELLTRAYLRRTDNDLPRACGTPMARPFTDC